MDGQDQIMQAMAEQTQWVITNERNAMRKTALQAALSMQPTNYICQESKKSVDDLITDCDKIYDWLVKDL